VQQRATIGRARVLDQLGKCVEPEDLAGKDGIGIAI